MKKKIPTYHEDLIVRLRKDPELRALYVDAALEAGDSKALLMALRNVTEAVGGMGKVAKGSGMNRQALYRILSKKGNPSLSTLEKVFGVLDLRLAVLPANHARAGAK